MGIQTKSPQESYLEFREFFKSKTNEELVKLFNKEVGNNGWTTTTRGSYLAAMHKEFLERGFNYSNFGGKDFLLLKHKIFKA